MLKRIGQYLSGVIRALKVRSGHGGIHAEAAMTSAEMDRLVRTVPDARDRIIAICECILRDAVKDQMQAAHIAELKDFGLSTGPLQKAGFRTVADLSGHSVATLRSLRGIGEITASAAMQAYEAFEQTCHSRVRLLPDPDDRRPHDEQMLVALTRYATLLRETLPRTESLKSRLADATGRLRSLQLGTRIRDHLRKVRAHSELEQATRLLSDELRWITSEAKALNDYSEQITPDPAGVWKRYSDNSAPFVALLERVLPPSVASNNAPFSPSMRGGLPADIADAVEATTIDLRLLTANLRRYQQFGTQYVVHQKRVLLGDDMGLGKTVQVLAAMCHLATKGHKYFFVVVPNSVLINWEREVRKHTKLKPIIVHGPDRDGEFDLWRRTGGVAITTFTTLIRLQHKFREAGQTARSERSGDSSRKSDRVATIDFMAVDEAHMVKNPGAQRAQAIKRMCRIADYVAFMSGTALENRLQELHVLVTTVQPKARRDVISLLDQIRPAPKEVRTKLAPVYLRRTQADVLKELPNLIQIDEVVPLEPADIVAYQSSQDNLMHRRLAATVGAGGIKSAKYARLKELLEVYEEQGRKVAVFSYFRQVLNDVSELTGGCPQIHGAISSGQRQGILDEFAALDGFGVIALQVDAGGVGINLQCAQVVILMEPQFKPSTERQAIARVMRMGQTRKVTAHRLIAKDTVDEALVRMIDKKTKIFNDYAHGSSVKDASVMATDSASAAMEELRSVVDQA